MFIVIAMGWILPYHLSSKKEFFRVFHAISLGVAT
jgi:hypothetical protein